MKLSFAICTHNEADYLRQSVGGLLCYLHEVADPSNYELVIVDDYSTDPSTQRLLNEYANDKFVKIIHHELDNDFASHKNYMNAFCTGEWILNLDADEMIPSDFLQIIPHIINSNPMIEAYFIPRVNTVGGITLGHVQKWNWTITSLDGFVITENLDKSSAEYELLKVYNLIIDETDPSGKTIYNQPIVCWPDFQARLYKNSRSIVWKGNVHEQLTGFTYYSYMPQNVDYAIRHHKEINRQEQQNNFYETLI